jgi:hypothetical protein
MNNHKKQYYTLPKNEEIARIDAIVIGGIHALRNFQDFQPITIEAIRERAIEVYGRSQTRTNDAYAYRMLFIISFTVGYTEKYIRYLEDRDAYEKEKAFLDEVGHEQFYTWDYNALTQSA